MTIKALFCSRCFDVYQPFNNMRVSEVSLNVKNVNSNLHEISLTWLSNLWNVLIVN